jgi:alpha/beta superfamily hydrolase
MPDYEHLHEAGYNVLCYDMRNFGHSGGIGSNGIFESRDVIGSLQYVTAREDLRDMTVGLFSRCCGGNATMIAMTNHPKYFTLCTRICNEACVHAAWWRRRVAVARWTLRSRYS